MDGTHEVWYQNRQMWSQANYRGNRLDGEAQSWYPDGRLENRSLWSNGKKREAWHRDPPELNKYGSISG